MSEILICKFVDRNNDILWKEKRTTSPELNDYVLSPEGRPYIINDTVQYPDSNIIYIKVA